MQARELNGEALGPAHNGNTEHLAVRVKEGLQILKIIVSAGQNFTQFCQSDGHSTRCI